MGWGDPNVMTGCSRIVTNAVCGRLMCFKVNEKKEARRAFE